MPVKDRRDGGGTVLSIKGHKGPPSFSVFSQLWLESVLLSINKWSLLSTSIHLSLSNFLFQDLGTSKSPPNVYWDHWQEEPIYCLQRGGLDYILAIQSDSILFVCFRVTSALPSGHQKNDKSDFKGNCLREQQLVYLKWKILWNKSGLCPRILNWLGQSTVEPGQDH